MAPASPSSAAARRNRKPLLSPRLQVAAGRVANLIGGWCWVQMFRSDRYLLFATLLLSGFALAPLFASPMLPLIDLGANIGAAMLLDDAAFGSGVVAEHYRVQPGIVPYWTGYLLLAALEHLVGVLWAMKAVLGLLVVAFPIAVMRVLVSLGRSPYVGLSAFLLTWDANMYWGWFTFQLGMVLALWSLAWVIEVRSFRDVPKLAVLAAVVALTHVHAVAFALTAGGLLTLLKRPLLPALKHSGVALLSCLGTLAPWLLARGSSDNQAALGFHVDQHPLGQKLAALHGYSLDNLPQAPTLTALAFLLLLVLPALLSVLPGRKLPPLQRFAPVAIVSAALLLYVLLPFAVHSPIAHWWTYPRFATYVLLGLVLCPAPILGAKAPRRLDGGPSSEGNGDGPAPAGSGRWRLLLAPVCVTAIALQVAIFQQFRQYGQYVSPYLEIVAAIEPNSRLLPIDLDDARFKGTRFPSLGQLHGYAAAMTSSYDGHLFDNPSNPLLFRRDRILPHPNWHEPTTFSMKEHGQFYDYIIVHPTDRDPIPTDPFARDRVDLVREAGPWRLYRVKHRKAHPGLTSPAPPF